MTYKDMHANKLVNGVPSNVYYFSDIISEEEEKSIIGNIYNAPKPKWTQLSNRRLQNWGGIPHNKGMIAEKIPCWLQIVMDKVTSLNFFPVSRPPNHVLINEYLPGQGIMQHLDGPLFYPTITTLSVGSHTCLNFYSPMDKDDISSSSKPIYKLLLEQRSLIIIQDEMYNKYLHSIEAITEDQVTDDIANLKLCSKNYVVNEILPRSTRLSLTIRHVPQTTKFKINLSKS